MKELSIEEKAKRYDEAIERAKVFKEHLLEIDEKDYADEMDYIFPELKESEDERIRKEMIGFFKGFYDNKMIKAVDVEPWLAWLEKQGVHANFRNKIQIGDKVTRNEDGVLVNLSQLKRVAKKDEKQGENNMGISEATKKKLEDNLNKALEKETPESCNEFLNKQSEQKPWSEEGDIRLNATVSFLERYKGIGYENTGVCISWLKSLKERYTWRPSDEQMDALHYVTNFDYGGHKATLVSLYEQLKKLKEE